jgi:gliding motility-associated-like protein
MIRTHLKTKTALFIIALISSVGEAFSQLQVSQQNPINLVNNVFVQQNSGVTVSNIQYTGSNQAIGFFNGQNSNIGLASGIVMTTGTINLAVGPNNKPDAGADNGAGGTALLGNLLGGVETFNASILRFNFISESDIVEFRYVFGSEEYPEWVGNVYNDIFAFFISGPGIAGNQNIAIIPGTNLPVAINNVNEGSFSQFFVNNGNGITSGGSSVQYDGFTRPLVAKANVIPCSTYTLTMAISDVGDAFYDSGVFLEASSFRGTEVQLVREISTGTDDLLEDCGKATIRVTRTGNTDNALTVWLQYSGNATYGIDYTAAPTSVTFQPNQSEITFNIEAFEDGIVEAPESVIITYRDTGCSGITEKVVSFNIIDQPPPINISLVDLIEIECPGEVVQINALVTGGVQPLNFSWNTGQTTADITVTPQQSTTYVITVNDVCGKPPVKDSVRVEIVNYIPMTLEQTPDTMICLGNTIMIGGVANGGKGNLSYFWQYNGSDQAFISVTPSQTSTYTLIVTDSCGISIIRDIKVEVMDVKAKFNISYIDNKTIKFNDLSYENIASWDWNFGDGIGSSNLQHPQYTYQDTGTFTVTLTVTNEAGCQAIVSNPVISYPPFSFYIPNAFTPNGDGLNDRFRGIGEGFVTYEMEIYNRWGEMIFFTENYRNPWGLEDRQKMEDLQSGVYVYKIRVGLPTGDIKEYIGRVTLVQ